MRALRTTSILVLFSLLAGCGGGEGSDRTQQGGSAPKSQANSGTSTGSSTATATDSATATGTGTSTAPTGDDQIATVSSGGLSFSIFKYEATVVDGKARSLKDSQPTVSINWNSAKTACEAAGYRLCKQAEWQAACKGAENLKFAYAATKDGPPKVEEACDVARTTNNSPGSLPSKTGSHPQCVTKGLDIYDMIGNASEWGYNGTDQPFALGVAFYQAAADSHCEGGLSAGPEELTSDVGFRCCK